MAQLTRDKAGLQTTYLQGGLAVWKWEKPSSLKEVHQLEMGPNRCSAWHTAIYRETFLIS